MNVYQEITDRLAQEEQQRARELRTHVHDEDIGFWLRIIPVAFEAARLNKLDLRELLPDSIGDGDGFANRQSCYGYCYPMRGAIRIVLRFRHPRTHEWLGPRPEAEVWQTGAHELAHLEEKGHTRRFDALMQNIQEDIDRLRRP